MTGPIQVFVIGFDHFEATGKIMAALPHGRITYQWDVCQEVLMWEGYLSQDEHPAFRTEIPESLSMLSGLVPPDVELGYHLCYGSPADEHLILPKDADVLVELANHIASGAKRPLAYIHLPVPRDRNDEDYFRPLENLKLKSRRGKRDRTKTKVVTPQWLQRKKRCRGVII